MNEWIDTLQVGTATPVQIIPAAPGWRVVCLNLWTDLEADATAFFFERPVICFALVALLEDDDTLSRFVAPITTDDWPEGTRLMLEETLDYGGLLSPGEEIDAALRDALKQLVIERREEIRKRRAAARAEETTS